MHIIAKVLGRSVEGAKNVPAHVARSTVILVDATVPQVLCTALHAKYHQPCLRFLVMSCDLPTVSFCKGQRA